MPRSPAGGAGGRVAPATAGDSATARDHHDAAPVPHTFGTALRGYERRQVDERVEELQAALLRTRAEAADAQRRFRLASDHAETTEQEVRELRATPPRSGSMENGFGMRAERLLRLAEQEAAAVRDRASREAVVLLDRAREKAEQHRHDVEKILINRATELDLSASQRRGELTDLEQQLAEQVAVSRIEAERLRTAIAQEADERRQESEAHARATILRAEDVARQVREPAEQEVRRLSGVRSDVHSELGRLLELLRSDVVTNAATTRRHA